MVQVTGVWEKNNGSQRIVTSTTCYKFSQTSSRTVLKSKYVHTLVLKLAFFMTGIPADQSVLCSSWPDFNHVPLCPVFRGFHQQSMSELLGKLTSHMLPSCSVFTSYQDVPGQIVFT